MKKPVGIIIVMVMDILRIIVNLFSFLISLFVNLLPAENEFRQGFELGIGIPLDEQVVGYYLGLALPMEIVLVALLVVICKRKIRAVTVLLILQLVFSHGSPLGFIWAGIMLLITMCNKKCRAYFMEPPIE